MPTPTITGTSGSGQPRPGASDDDLTNDDFVAGERLFASPWGFVLSAPRLDVLPPADRPEIAFAGRSNVGKSSLINAIVRRHGLARTSNTPGRTQELNFFATAAVPFYLVDMPGYGFAKAPKAKVDEWTALVRDYLRGRGTLRRVLLLVDARHGLKTEDGRIMELLDEAAVSYQLILTKTDKIGPAALADVIDDTRRRASTHPAAFPTLLDSSAQSGHGIDRIRAQIARLLKT